jgi:glycolate oxidase FAD binding subunit
MTLAAQSVEATRARLVEIAGESNVVTGEKAALFSAFGEQPVAVVYPVDEAQVAEVARLANAEKIQVVPWGAGTKQGIEPVQPRDGIVLNSSKLTSTLELDAANLTVTVESGKVVADLQRELATVNLFLPLDPVDSDRSTIGGLLASNSSGPNRLLYRAARDWVLGMRVVTPFGEAVRAGGKTVKDVAGYDMKKLYMSSWGMLGAITSATFRLLPIPEAQATVVMEFPALADCCTTVSALLSSFMRPSTAELISAGMLPESMEQKFGMKSGEFLLAVQFEGAVEAVDRQKQEMQELAKKGGAKEILVLEGADEKELWRERKVLSSRAPSERPSMVVKGSVPLKRVVDFTGGLGRISGAEAVFAAHAGNGIVYALVSAEPGQMEKLVPVAEQLQKLAADCGGFALILKAPSSITGRLKLWPARSDYGIMRKIKAQLDPNNLWNPARVPGGSL